MSLQIHWFKAQAPRRVLALAKHLGVAVEYIEQNVAAGALRQADYLALNPNGKAPTLVDGDYVLWESNAIMAYLSLRAGSDAWPAQNPREQVEVLRWLAWNDCHWAPLIGTYYFERIIKPQFGLGEADLALLDAERSSLRRHAKILDRHLAGRDFVCCDRLTIADFSLASMATYHYAPGDELAEFPQIVRWLDGLQRIPAWADPWPPSRPRAGSVESA